MRYLLGNFDSLHILPDTPLSCISLDSSFLPLFFFTLYFSFMYIYYMFFFPPVFSFHG